MTETNTAVAPPAQAVVPARSSVQQDQPGKIQMMWKFFLWIITIGGLLTWPFRKLMGRTAKNRFKNEEICVYSIHHAFFLWPTILLGFVGGSIVKHMPDTAGFWGWVYCWTVLITMLAVLVDIDTIKLIIWGAILGFIWIASKWLQDVKGIPVLSPLFGHIRGLNPRMDPGTVGVISWMLLGPWVAAMFHSFSRGRNTFTPNGIKTWQFGKGDEMTDRMGLHFQCHYNDLIEFVLTCGGGDVIAQENSTDKERKRWENIPFLFFRWKTLEEILEQRASVIDNAEEDPVEVEDIHHTK